MTSAHGFADPTVSLDLLERIEAGDEHPPKPDFLDADEWSMIVDSRDRTIVRSAGVGHAEAYQAVGGEGLDETQGGPVLVLTTVGRKTGNDVRTCVNYVRDGDAFYVVGSFAGFGGEPHWSRNLAANPAATVQVRDDVARVRAERVSGDERAALWPMLTGHFPLWGHFQRYCRREFALWRLTTQP